MLVGRLKCFVHDDLGYLALEECPDDEYKSCYFAVNGDIINNNIGTIDRMCSNIDTFINTCYMDRAARSVMCWCNGDGCNIYCAWVNCKPEKIQFNSTNVDFPDVLNSTLKEWDEECTAKCWPIV